MAVDEFWQSIRTPAFLKTIPIVGSGSNWRMCGMYESGCCMSESVIVGMDVKILVLYYDLYHTSLFVNGNKK